MKPIRILAASVAAAVALALPVAAAATTFDLQAHVYCPTANHPCGYNSQGLAAQAILANIAEMNLEFTPAHISFRPKPPLFHYGTKFSNISNSSGMSADGVTKNEDLVLELLDTVSNTDQGEVNIFLVPGLPKCWTNPPPKPGDTDYVYVCSPSPNNGGAYAHEMGHFFCLRHTQTFDDLQNSQPNLPNDDLDASVAAPGFAILDTPPDPGPKEKYDNTIVDKKNKTDGNLDGNGNLKPDENAYGYDVPLHDWCAATSHPATASDPLQPDPGSPHGSFCDGVCTSTDAGGSESVNPFYAPIFFNAMSYHGCPGPFVRNGLRYEGFTTAQQDLMNACFQTPLSVNRGMLVDVCAGRGGDLDNDGICTDDDSCPLLANLLDGDTDGDGIANSCDNCKYTDNTDQSDLDGDGDGDVCDSDEDGDGCFDWKDQHPADPTQQIGTWVSATCQAHSGPEYGFEGDDSDHDGILNCEDTDDDNDGVLDADDPCPTTPGAFCPFARDCGGSPAWFELCQFGGCNDLILKVVDAVNPDPNTTLRFDRVEILGQKLYLHPPGGKAPSEAAMGILGAANVAAGRASTAPAQRRLDLLSKSTGRLLATVGVFDPSTAVVGDILHGGLVVLTPPASRMDTASVGTGWTVAAGVGPSLPDTDGDGVPDTFDDCREVANPAQKDGDHDGYGDRCDADLDGDGNVTPLDLRIVKRCAGYHLGPHHPPLHYSNEQLDPDMPLDGRLQFAVLSQKYNFKVEKKLIAQSACDPADLDGNGVVDAADYALARAALGSAPGPSGRLGK